MKRMLMLVVLLGAAVITGMAQYPHVNVRDLQYSPPESLAVADGITGYGANSAQARWTLQVSSRMKKYTLVSASGAAVGDTVVLTALCVVPPKVMNWNVGGWTMLLYDTAKTNTSWGGVLAMAIAAADTSQLFNDGFLNVAAGDIVTMTGVVAEFPNTRGFSGTEFCPVPGKAIQIEQSGVALPTPIAKSTGDFYQGTFSTGTTKYRTGEPYEGMLVQFTNLTVNAKVNTGRGTFSATDVEGNEISTYDLSKFFTLASGRYPDSTWIKAYANIGVGTRIDTIRGVITTSSGSEGPRGYRVAPIYRSDIVFNPNPAPPLVSTHRRFPVVVTPDSAARISVKVTRQTNGSSPNTVALLYSINNAAYQSVAMTYQASDTTYNAAIPQQLANTFVKYFIQATDSLGQVVRLANSSLSGGVAIDTSKGVFCYTSLSRPLTIQDVQYTPFINGRTPYLGAVLSLSGIMTADTLHMSLSPATTGSTNAWYMQSTNQPWSGIWLATADTAVQRQLSGLRNGDSIKVTGTVQEQFDVTRLGNITEVVEVSSGNPEPAPVVRTTGSLNVGNGTPSAEAYEGMVVQLNNVTVTNVAATYSDNTEFSVNDGSGETVVQRSGVYTYSNLPTDTASGKIILHVGDKIGALRGIVYYSFNQYKFVPRTNADFVNVVLTGVAEPVAGLAPARYELSQNYPNPFNPSTTIRYAIPTAGLTTVKVFNLLGQEVATLVNEVQAAGAYTVHFNASSLSSGVYFFRIQSSSFTAVRKMVLLK
jgi:hypothetical protein